MARKLAYTLRIPIRWGDMDAMGHVNNTLYFRYMEEARTTWYDSVGINDNGPALPAGCGPVIVNAGCTFVKAMRYPGDVEVKLYLDQPGNSSVMTIYEMRAGDDPGTLCAEGTAKAVWIDMAHEKSIPLPDPVRALLEA